MSSQLQVTGEAKIRDIQGPVVANSGVITALDGAASQYVRGDGTLADFPTSSGGGSSVSYYLNSSVSQGTIGGVAYRELSKEPIIGAGTDIAISSNGYVASYLTDANDPDVVLIPGGNFNCEFYFSVNNNTGNPFTYAELYKYDGTTFTLLGSSVGVPEYITQGTTIAPYYFAIPVPTSALALTDRLAIRIYVNVGGRTVTLHTENGHLCQVVTTLSKGMVSLNNLTDQSQFLAVGTSGTDFNIVSSGDTHTFNIPSASATNRGLITTGTQTIAGAKTFSGTANFTNTNGTGLLYGFSLGKGSIPSGFASSNVSIFADSGVTNLVIANDPTYQSKLQFQDTFALADSFTYTFPAATGTLALTSNLSSYVPYTGATGSVNLGLNNLTANNVFGETSLNVKILASGSIFSSGYSTLSSLAGKFTIAQQPIAGTLKAFTFDFSAWSTSFSNTYTLPDLSGTLALLEADNFFTEINMFDIGINYKTNAAQGLVSGYISQAYAKSGSGAGSILSMSIADGNSVKNIRLDFVGSPATYTYTFPALSGTMALLEGTQTFSGAKTFDAAYFNGAEFNNTAYFNEGLWLVKNGVPIVYTALQTTIYSEATTNNVVFRDNASKAKLEFNNSTQTYTFPAASGTLALTSNLSSYVPYSGATANVDLAGFSLYLNNSQAIFGRNSTGTTAYALIGVNPSNKVSIDTSALGVVFGGTIGNGTYTYTFPNATGTLALTSNLSAYLPLTGGTLTGALSGTSATFSGDVIRTSSNIGGINEIAVVNSATSGASSSRIRISTAFTGGTTLGDAITQYTDNNNFNWCTGSGVTTSRDYVIANHFTLGTSVFFRLAASTGAATFSSSVTFSGALIQTTSTANAFYFSGGTTTGQYGRWENTGARMLWGIEGSAGNAIFGGSLAYSTVLGTNNATALHFSPNNVVAMTIINGGNVGIGTTTATAKLQISNTSAGAATVAAFLLNESRNINTEVRLAFAANTNNDIASNRYSYISTLNTTGDSNGQSMIFATNENGAAATERMRISSLGALTYNTTDAQGWFAGFSVNGTNFAYLGSTGQFANSGGTATDFGIRSANALAFYTSGGNERMRITSAGNTQPGADNAYSLGVSGTRWSAVWAANGTIQTSDEREKKDIIDADLGLDFISKLRPVSFKWKVGQNIVTSEVVKDEEGNPILDEEDNEKTESVIVPREGKRTHYGLIAQEVEELLDGKDFGGFIHDEETDTKGLRYDQFIPLLIKSIQELEAKIVTLESKLN